MCPRLQEQLPDDLPPRATLSNANPSVAASHCSFFLVHLETLCGQAAPVPLWPSLHVGKHHPWSRLLPKPSNSFLRRYSGLPQRVAPLPIKATTERAYR
jgi:hypothetical protein